jgi:hypothetical protein
MKLSLSVALSGLIILLGSCTKNLLNVTPTDRLSDATVWSDTGTAKLFLNDIYNQLNPGPWSSIYENLPTEISSDPLDNFTDNSLNGNLGVPSYTLFANDSYNASNGMFNNQWANMYTNIRKCNLCLGKIAVSSLDSSFKRRTIAQARFLRAYFYKSLIDLYGGVPLITQPLNNENEADTLFYPRSSYADCVAFVQSECTSAAKDLPTKVATADLGHATWGAAMAMKGEEELYAGDWQDAAADNLQLMQSGLYSLYPDCEALFYQANEDNQEVIFDIQYAPIVKGTAKDSYWGVVKLSDGTGYGGANPSQSLVDEYEFIDGKTIAQGSAYYDPTHPYLNREKRFYASVIYDGAKWRNDTVYTRLGIANNINQLNIAGAGNASERTGYYCKKTLDPSTLPGSANISQHTSGANQILWRYAEILLNYAEAQNELSGPDQSVYDAINKVRERAAQPDLPTGLSQSDMRDRIHHERRIELSFEAKRFFDIMRWKIAGTVFQNPVQAMQITKNPDGTLNYKVVDAQKVIFDATKNYLQPIPQSALDKNVNLKQNPNY